MTDWANKKQYSIQDVLKILPHRFPFLMIDRVLDVVAGPEGKKGTVVKAMKNVTINEIQFQGHFPENPVLPGVLTLEAMAQAGAFATARFVAAENQGVLVAPLGVALASFDKVRFRKPVVPGDRMDITVEVKQTRGPMWSFEGRVDVDGKCVAEGSFMAVLQSGGKP